MAGLRRWILIGSLGVLVVLIIAPLNDAWTVNRAGIMINRAIVVEAGIDSARTGPAVMGDSAAVGEGLATAKTLLEDAALSGSQDAGREIPIWRSYGAAAALAPTNQDFALLMGASESDFLDRIGELWLGEVASATGHPAEATAAYQRVDASNLLISRADAYMESGDKENAVRQYEFARASLEAAIQRESAQRLLVGGASGASVTDTLMTSDAERVTELYRIGRGLLAAGEPAEAVPVLEEAQAKAQTASPGEVVAQSIDLNLALALARTLPDPQSSDAADPTDSPTQIARVRGLVSEGLAVGPTAPVDVIAGRALLLVGDEEQATSLFRQAIHLDPLLPDAYLALGDWYESKGMKLLPLHLYAQAVKALPDNPQIAVAYAIAAYRAEAPTEALPILQQTAEMPTDDPYLFAFLGDCYLDLGMAVQAQAAYEEGLQRAPNAKPLVDRLHTLDKWMKAHNG